MSSFAFLWIAALWLLCWPYRCLPSWAEVIFDRSLPSTSGNMFPLFPVMPPFSGFCYSVLANALLAFSLAILIKRMRGRRPSKSVLLVSLLGPVILIVSVPHLLISFDSSGLPESTTGFVRAAYASSVLSDQSWSRGMFFQGRIAGTGDHRILVLRNTEEGQFLGLDLGPSPARAFRANLSDWLGGRCAVVSMGMQWYAAQPRISDFKYVEIAGTRFSLSTGFLIDYSLSFDARHVALFATRHRPTSFGNTFPQRIYVEVQRTEDARVVAAFSYYAKDGIQGASCQWLGVEGLMVPTGFDQESFVIALWPSAKSNALPLPKSASPPYLNKCGGE